jgi:N-acylglucosamine-6-phosphate 2-epimerase
VVGHHAQADRFLRQVKGGLAVSLMTSPGDPDHDPRYLVPRAQSVELGGARAVVTGSAEAFAAVSGAVSIPVLAGRIVPDPGGGATVVSTVEATSHLVAAGARLVLVDASARTRPGNDDVRSVVDAVHAGGAIAIGVVAEPSDLPNAFDAGLDIVGTNPFGREAPNDAFLRWLVRHSAMPVFAGSPAPTPDDGRQAIAAGAVFLLAGGAIVDPAAIVARYVAALSVPRRT